MLSTLACPFRSHISPSSSKAPGAAVDTEKTSVEKTEASHGDSPLLPSRCAMSLSELAAAASATSPAACSCMPNASAGLEVFALKSHTANEPISVPATIMWGLQLTTVRELRRLKE
eukprot:CAMPEP_0172683540 /NCGR_PEP_ID=MMETSP1074-20121228/18926_1 /TAXON_ID=2916 /ORGANISM="Ceratium fusus, Strain PA161109" /LENGTH=115 /DNA_ID=CAMNT_0013502399 /DNA_START=1158 /DNA_END=1505 /DNA_ORIENTATION=-